MGMRFSPSDECARCGRMYAEHTGQGKSCEDSGCPDFTDDGEHWEE